MVGKSVGCRRITESRAISFDVRFCLHVKGRMVWFRVRNDAVAGTEEKFV